MKLKDLQKPELAVSHKLVEAMKILQMTDYELSVYITEIAECNPVIDLEVLQTAKISQLSLEKLDWLTLRNHSLWEESAKNGEEDLLQNVEDTAVSQSDRSLKSYLFMQISDSTLPATDQAVCRYLASCVDDKGYLDMEADQLSTDTGISLPQAQRCFQFMRSLDPCGVCASDMQHCLQRQAEKSGNVIAAEIIRNYLEQLGKGYYSQIARALDVELHQVYNAEKAIHAFEPKPGRAFDNGERTDYLPADILINCYCGDIYAELCNSFLPSLGINSHYMEVMRATDDESVRDYLSRKLYQANSLIEHISQREKTLLGCAQAIAELQKEFFYGKGDLVPMREEDVASLIGVDKSTVSRAIRGKNIQCSKGVLPVRTLFFQKLDGRDAQEWSAEKAKQMLLRLVVEEDKGYPLSDQRLCEMLHETGLGISRRTLAKYRNQLGIPSMYIRQKKQI